MATLTVTVRPGYNFPEGAPVDLAAHRLAAVPEVEIEGEIDTATIADNSITAAKLQSNSVTTPKIADGAVTEPKIADGAVTQDKVAASAINDSKIDGQLSADVLEEFTGPQGGILVANTTGDRGKFLRGDATWQPIYSAMENLVASRSYI